MHIEPSCPSATRSVRRSLIGVESVGKRRPRRTCWSPDSRLRALRPMATTDQFRSRRDEYAEATWQAVVTAARELFGEAGYSATTVQQIARRARVSPATVYAQCGGKKGLLKTLMDSWTAGPLVREIIEACAAARSGAEKLHVLADGYLAIYKAFGDITRIVTDAAAAVPDAAEFLETANARHHEALVEIVTQIRKAGDLKKSLSDKDAARI